MCLVALWYVSVCFYVFVCPEVILCVCVREREMERETEREFCMCTVSSVI